MEDIKYQLFSTPLLRVLDVLLQDGGELSDAEVTERAVAVKRAAVHQALVKLADMGVTERIHRGRRCFNRLNGTHAWLVPFRILSNLLVLEPLIDRIKPIASKIVLFGSRAQGTSHAKSDFDLIVVTTDTRAVQRMVDESTIAERVQTLYKTPEQMLSLDEGEPVLAEEIRKGIVLWET